MMETPDDRLQAAMRTIEVLVAEARQNPGNRNLISALGAVEQCLQGVYAFNEMGFDTEPLLCWLESSIKLASAMVIRAKKSSKSIN